MSQFIHSAVDGNFGNVHLGTTILSAAMNVLVHAFWWICVCVSVEYIRMSRIAGS